MHMSPSRPNFTPLERVRLPDWGKGCGTSCGNDLLNVPDTRLMVLAERCARQPEESCPHWPGKRKFPISFGGKSSTTRN